MASEHPVLHPVDFVKAAISAYSKINRKLE
jgi:hypothetical protein